MPGRGIESVVTRRRWVWDIERLAVKIEIADRYRREVK